MGWNGRVVEEGKKREGKEKERGCEDGVVGLRLDEMVMDGLATR